MERCLIMDFDDTLVKTIDVHADSWKQALERVLDREIPIKSIYADINYGMDILLKKYQLTEKESQLAQKYKKEIFAKNIHKTKVNELLLYLIKNKVFETYVIASNSSRENINKIMSYHGIDPNMFSLIISRDDVSEKKPHPEMGQIIFEKYADIYTKNSDYLMIGDSEVDLTFASKLNIKCVIVNF
jgi:phosphoglycolate phosphatase-like HAD superfamily hydrolase